MFVDRVSLDYSRHTRASVTICTKVKYLQNRSFRYSFVLKFCHKLRTSVKLYIEFCRRASCRPALKRGGASCLSASCMTQGTPNEFPTRGAWRDLPRAARMAWGIPSRRSLSELGLGVANLSEWPFGRVAAASSLWIAAPHSSMWKTLKKWNKRAQIFISPILKVTKVRRIVVNPSATN